MDADTAVDALAAAVVDQLTITAERRRMQLSGESCALGGLLTGLMLTQLHPAYARALWRGVSRGQNPTEAEAAIATIVALYPLEEQ